MSDSDPVTHEQCERYRTQLSGDLHGCIFQEREDRKEDLEQLQKAMERLENRMEGMNSKLSTVVLELLVGLLLGVMAYIGGKI